ncbi:hypothetical protein MSG28_000832 [Choristoneura fumiferana]|uniref:Uncharacterized protein n=1 Tax=Choristoneura fumiferana TaxID=7141 RepID=A0ACC0K2L2_CHOFU|nr:hypothetical protein MSG28_000832 [Choristoneura fumiferana]
MLRSTKHSSLLVDNEEIIFVNEWAVSRPVAAGEVLTLQLLTRGRWGAPRVLGVYRLGLQILVTDGQLSITDTLVDERNKPVPVFVEMDVFYTAPATLIAPPVNDAVSRTSEAGSARSALVSAPGSRGSLAGSRSSAASDADDDNALEDIQRNIAILERSLQNKEAVVDIESGDESRARRIKSVGKRILRRGFSMGSEKVVTISERERKRPTTMKSMRSLIRLGRARPRSASTDEERGLLEPGPSTEPERPSSQTSMSSEELLVDTRSPTDTPKLKKIRSALDTGGPSALKAADFQVCVTVIEARQLAGLNMDPVVCVQVGDGRKYTSVKESTNCPYYNEYFVFDFHMPPIMLFDKIITLSVLQSRHILRANKLLGSFKLDVATVWNQPDRQFYHKWALLTDPDDIAAGAKGYLKCDISVIGKGDTVKIPPKSEKDEDDIEANLLLPDGVPIERQRAKFVVKIYKADGLPKMNYSILANVKRAFTGETQDLVDPYVQVCFAGMTIVFTEMFPPLCQRIKIQLRDNDPVHPNIIGTHFIDLKSISNDGEKDNMECPASDVEVEIVPPITESTFGKNEEFFLFASIFDANMIDKRLTDKPIQFELSIGNSGNSLDGHSDSVRRPQDLESDELDEMSADTGYWQSTTAATKASSLSDKSYYYLPYWDHKQCMHVRSIWPDHRRRMYNSNLIANVIEKFNEGGRDSGSVAALRAALEAASAACAQYARHVAQAPPIGNTKLDRERQKMCLFEIEQMSTMTKSLRALITKHSIKDRLRTAYTYLNKLKRLCEDPQQAMPDVFIWMISNGKRLAYQRITARDIIYSDHEKEGGKHCGKMQTFFLKWPGKKASSPSGWNIPAKISVYLWLGVLQDKKHYIDGLPQGYELSLEIRNADKLRSNAPAVIFYAEKHIFQMRAYIYQARSLIGSDSSGLSDPFAKVIIGSSTATTQVIDETLSPTWDELLLFEDILLYSTIEQIRADPPTIVIEIFDQDNVGKSEFIGRTLAKPHVKAFEDPYERPQFPPSLEWHEITRGDDKAGELLAAFELLEIPSKLDSTVLPELPMPREATGKVPLDANKGPIFPVPRGIRPTLSKYRIEVLFWGLRDLKRVHLLTVDKPRVDIECAGNILYSSVIQNAKRNPNFTNPVKFVDVELPDQDLYRPPLTIRVVDCRSFGRITLVGTHTINSIHKYIYTPMSKREKEIEERKKSLIQLQNVDLKANCIVHDDMFSVENEKENCPLLTREGRSTVSYGSGVRQSTRKRDPKGESFKKRKASTDSVLDDDERSKDWWTKYFASVECMIEEEKEAKKERQGYLQTPQVVFVDETRSPREEVHSPRPERDRFKRRRPLSPRAKLSPTILKKNEIPTSALSKIYPHELEAVSEFDEFKEWLHSFELYRGKKTGDDAEDESRVVGVPSNDPIHVLVRVYIVKATDLHPMDLNGKADPYIVLHLGSKRISDKENYVSKQLNPVFGKCFEIEATFPQDSMLTIQVLDWDLLGSDDMIGETKIDLENRFYSRHRATCGLPMKYEEQGYNRWRDAMKPTQILAKLCKDGKLDPPVYEYGRVKIGRSVFNMPMHDSELFSDVNLAEEQMALLVLRRWHELPRVGARLVPEHVETRPLYNPNKPGIEQGRLEMWVDMFPMDMPLPGPPMDISARKPKSYEMRVIIWNTDDVVLEDDAFFTGEKMSDIYAEERIVISRKESVFSWDETECKIPARLELQVWDADHFSADDFLGALTLDLNRFPRGAKSSKLCTLEMLSNDGTVPMVNIFKQKRVKGWWPFYIKRDTEEMELTGKVEAEIHLLTREEADKVPAGLGRNEPDPLDKPNRPDASFMWFLNPLKSIRYIVWHNYKWTILKATVILLVAIMFLLLIYAVPGYSVKKLLGA